MNFKYITVKQILVSKFYKKKFTKYICFVIIFI